MNSGTTIRISLLNRLGDEVGEVEMENARMAAAGMDTASPDLADQMAQLDRRLYLVLAELNLAPVLDPLAVRIAVSRALLQPTPAGVVIPLQIRPVDGAPQYAETHGRTPGTVSDPGRKADGWDDLFTLGTEEEALSRPPTLRPPTGSPGGGPDRRAAGKPGCGDLDDLDRANQLDGWEALGQAWEMDDEGGWQ